MALDLTKLAQAYAKGVSQTPQLILEIDGVPTIYGVGTIKKYIRIGDTGLEIGNAWTIGGFNDVEDQEDLISFEGSTTNITQQLLQDKGGASSVSAVQISLIDLNQKITQLISPGVVVPELLGRKARVYLGYQGTPFPDDFVVLFSGIIDDIDGGDTIIIQVAHPEAGKRFDIFQERTTKLTAPADFRSLTLWRVKFVTRTDVVGTVTVSYVGGGVAGSEVVTVVGTAITVTLEENVSTASQVRNAIEKSIEALALVEVSIEKGHSSDTVGLQPPTALESDDTIEVESTNGFLAPADSGTLRTYIRIDDEIIEYTGMTATQFTGCTREAFADEDDRAVGAYHPTGREVRSFYRLQGNAFDLALKLMLSGADEYFLADQEATSVNTTPDNGVIQNAIYFKGLIASDRFGLVPGDFATFLGNTITANNFTLRTILDVVTVEGGSYIVVDGPDLTDDPNPDGLIKFKSKYNVLPAGAGLNLGGDQVDVPEFERLRDLYFSSVFTYDFYLTSTEKGKDFIDTDILFPTGAFSIPRKGKISVGFTSSPLSIAVLPVLNSDNTVQPNKNRIRRTINKYFYNNVVFKYHQNCLDSDRYLRGAIEVDADSKTKIKVGNKSLTIVARGLRPSTDNDTIMSLIIAKLLERYRFAAEMTKARFFYGEAFFVDVGDVVLYGDQALNLIDTRKGVRGFDRRVFEVVNKSLDLKTGAVVLDLVDTHYLNEGRFGVFGPGSLVDVGSTTSVVKVKTSFGTKAPQTEKRKWTPYIGEKITVRSEDWSDYDETVLTAIDPSNDNALLVDPALSFTPGENYIVEQPAYPSTDADDGAVYKQQHPFLSPSPLVDAGFDLRRFSVKDGEVDKFFVGAIIVVHNADYTQVSVEAKVESIDVGAGEVTVDRDLGFMPDTDFIIDLIGFVDDSGPAYRFI